MNIIINLSKIDPHLLAPTSTYTYSKLFIPNLVHKHMQNLLIKLKVEWESVYTTVLVEYVNTNIYVYALLWNVLVVAVRLCS